MAHSVDYDELYRNVTIHCPSVQFSEIDYAYHSLSYHTVFFIESIIVTIMSKLNNKINYNASCIINYINS